MTKRVATCSQFLERGEDYSLFYSRSFIIYITIYADAISLAMSACTKDWKMYFAKNSKASYETKKDCRNTDCKFQRSISKRKRCLILRMYTWSIVRCVYWADVIIWRLQATSIWKLESMLVHRVTWRSPWEIIADTNCRYLSKRGRAFTSSNGIFTRCYEYKDNFISIGSLIGSSTFARWMMLRSYISILHLYALRWRKRLYDVCLSLMDVST